MSVGEERRQKDILCGPLAMNILLDLLICLGLSSFEVQLV